MSRSCRRATSPATSPGWWPRSRVVCALIQRLSHGAGQLIDVSANEAAAQITDWSLSNSSKAMVEGVEPMETRAGPGPVYTILAAADGFVRLVVLSTRQWQAMRGLAGRARLPAGPRV